MLTSYERFERIAAAAMLVTGLGLKAYHESNSQAYTKNDCGDLRLAAQKGIQNKWVPTLGETKQFTTPSGDILVVTIESVTRDFNSDNKPEICVNLQRPDGTQTTACADVPKGP